MATYEIGGKTFRSKTSVLDYVRDIRARYADGAMLSPDDAAFMGDLLRRHPAWEHKIGCGVAGFSVSTEPVFKTRCFRVHRIDGSATDFSVRECVVPMSRRVKVMRAFRTAVVPDILAFKDHEFAKGPVVCPHTGRALSPRDCHVDHEPPVFARIVDDFLALHHLTIDNVALIDTDARDNMYAERLANYELAGEFIGFHRDKATLRLIAPEVNTATLHGDADAV